MNTKIFKTLAITLLFPLLGLAFVNTNSPEEIELSFNSAGELIEVVEPTSWTNGNINQFYLDLAHTQKTFNNIRLATGSWKWKVRTNRRNYQTGKVNFDIHLKFQNGSNSKVIDKKLLSGREYEGTFNISDYKAQSEGSPAGYGMIKVHIGRAAANTNVNYKITLTRNSSGSSFTVNSSSANNSQSSNCNYTSLGSKTGNVVGNTVGKYKSVKKACKNNVSVRVTKTGGKARTTILIYASSTKNGNYIYKGSTEFPKNYSGSSKTVNISGVNNKFIKVEVKNRSATNRFLYNLAITQ